MSYTGTLRAELRDANPHTHVAVRRLVEHCGGEVLSIAGTRLVAHPAPSHSGAELLMRHLLADPNVIPESVGWS